MSSVLGILDKSYCNMQMELFYIITDRIEIRIKTERNECQVLETLHLLNLILMIASVKATTVTLTFLMSMIQCRELISITLNIQDFPLIT